MKNGLRVGILGAGLGSRLQSVSHTKALAAIDGIPLVARLQRQLLDLGAEKISLALRDELLTDTDKAGLPRDPRIEYIFVNTDSSLHTLAALVEHLGPAPAPVLFSMVDTILRPDDLRAFWDFCRGLPAGECAVLGTKFVDDEKPLWVRADKDGYVTSFGAPTGDFITSGMYFLSPEAMQLAPSLVASGTHKMRNFLAHLVERGAAIKTFVVEKTIDVDHPSDLAMAADFLRGTKGSST